MSANNYTACLKEVLKHEGGYANNPRDPGGETMYGITIAVARAHGYQGRMRDIPMNVVERIYRSSYWTTAQYKCDTLAPGVDLATFDYGVNSGPGRAGPALKAAAGGSAVDTVKKLCASRLRFLRRLGTWRTFGTGWARRVAQVEAVGVRMALAGAGKTPDQVKKKLDTESAAAARKRNAQAGGAAASPAAPAVDPSAFDLGTIAGVVAVVVVIGVIGWLAYRAYINHARAQAYAEAAKEAAP